MRLIESGPKVYQGTPALLFMTDATLVRHFNDAYLADMPIMTLRRVPQGVRMHIVKKYEQEALREQPDIVSCLLRRRTAASSLVLSSKAMQTLNIQWINAFYEVEQTPQGVVLLTKSPLSREVIQSRTKRVMYAMVSQVKAPTVSG